MENVAGEIDAEFCKLADKTESGALFEFIDSREGVVNDFIHLAPTLNALIWNTGGFLTASEEIIDIFAGWGGDCLSFSKDIKFYAEDENDF